MNSFDFAAFLVIAIHCSGFGATATNALTPARPSPAITNATFQSGIRGEALAGPISPVERPGHPNSRPLHGAIMTVQLKGGKEIERQKADNEGRFIFALPKGTYLLVPFPPQPGSTRPHAIAQSVKVESNKFTEVTVYYDTGIR